MALAAASLVAPLFGCGPKGGGRDGGWDGSVPARGAAGVKVPLPEGWKAELGESKALLAGPAGRPVLRVDVRPGVGDDLPSPDELASGFLGGLKLERPGAQVTTLERESRPAFTRLRLLVRGDADGGAGEGSVVFLGARKLGGDLFLCSTEPGARDAEVDEAEKACETLTVSQPP